MSVAGICGNILGLMNWKSQIQDEIVLKQKQIRGWTEEDSFWTQEQNLFKQGDQSVVQGSYDLKSPTNMDSFELLINPNNGNTDVNSGFTTDPNGLQGYMYTNPVNADGSNVTNNTFTPGTSTSANTSTNASAWGMIQWEIENIQAASQFLQAEISEEQSDEATINDEITADQTENKENNKAYYGNPFA